MKKIFSLTPILLTTLCLACIFLFTQCSHKKIGGTEDNKKEVLIWTITFKPNATNKEITTTLGEFDNYLLNQLNPQGNVQSEKKDSREALKEASIPSFRITHNFIFRGLNHELIVEITGDSRAATGIGRIKGSPIPPPKHEDFIYHDKFNFTINYQQ
ncbi:MAG: hypothetical protein QM802_13765 [Agriterribacter sp.]